MSRFVRSSAGSRTGAPSPALSCSSPAVWLLALVLLVCPGQEAAAQAATQQVRISTDRLRRIGVPDSLLREPAPVISRGAARPPAEVRDDGILLSRGELAVLRTGEAARVVPGPVGEVEAPAGTPAPEAQAPFFTTDLRFVTPDATLSGEWVLRPVYKVANRLRWEPEAGVFKGAIFLAIEDSLRRGESRPLPAPVRFQLLTEADAVEPAELEFEHTNFPLRRVDISARTASDSLRVHLVPEFDVNGTDIWVPVVPYLLIETTPERIQGWGVQTAQVVVRLVGTTSAASTSVSLTSSAGELETVQLELGASGSGAVQLRSAGAGESVLRASAPGLGDAAATIVFVWPWVFLLAALSGGVFGGLAAAAQERRSGGEAKWGASTLKGLLVGVLAALVWYTLGVNLLGIDLGVPRQNELAVAGLAALAGFFGVPKMKSRKEEEAVEAKPEAPTPVP